MDALKQQKQALRPMAESLESRRLMAAGIEVIGAVTGNPISDGDAAPTAIKGTDFGTAFVAGELPIRSFQITNTSQTDDLNLSGLKVPVGFKIEQDLPDLLGPGSSATISISLVPTAQQTFTGDVSFTTNVPGAETFNFAVSGKLSPASTIGENIFDDTSGFTDQDFVAAGSGTDVNGLPVASVTNRVVRFNVPIGQANVSLKLQGTLPSEDQTRADAEVAIVRDANGDGLLDFAEYAQPVTMLLATSGAGEQTKTVPLAAATYFGVVRVANFLVLDAAVEQPNVRVDYQLSGVINAIQPAAIGVSFGNVLLGDNDTTPATDDGTDFGSVFAGQTAPVRTFTVTNPGGETLQLGVVAVTGNFELVSGLPSTLASGASATFSVRMPTTTVGGKTGQVSFSTNVGANNPFNFAIAGTVAKAPAGEISVSLEGTGGLLDGQTAPVDFGTLVVGQTGVTRTFFVQNDGNAVLSLGAVTLPAGFTLTEPLATSLAPGAIDTFTIALSTATAGTRSGTLSIASGDADENPFDISLTAVVAPPVASGAPEISVSLENGGELEDGQSPVVSFGGAVQGQPGTSLRFIVRNDGTAPLSLTSVSVPGGFTISEPLETTLAPGAVDGFTVTLATTTAGQRSGTIQIATNDSDENPFNFNVAGTVAGVGSTTGAELTVLVDGVSVASGASVDFGSAAVGGASPERTLTIRNDGTGLLTVEPIVLPTGFTLLDGFSGSLAAGASATLKIGLSTASAGAVTGQAALTNNDADESPFTLALVGSVDGSAEAAPIRVGNVIAKVAPTVVAGTKQARGTIAFTVTNADASVAFAGPVTLAVVSSSDAVRGTSDSVLFATTRVLKLKAGASKVIRLKFAFASDSPAGNKVILVSATALGATSDGVGPAVEVQTPVVQLTGLVGASPSGPVVTFGKRATFIVPLQNVGNVPTGKSPATYTLTVTSDGTDAGKVYETSATGRISLKPGASRPQKLSLTLPAGVFPAGSYTLLVKLTADLNQTNGKAVAAIPFTVA